MKVASLITTYNKCRKSDKATKFEKDFISSLVKNAPKYCSPRLIPNDIFHSANRDNKLKFSEKQMDVYNQIKEKYNPDSTGEDLYHKYSKIFRDKDIELDSFDTRHLETFKGIMKESENFLKWVASILKE